jgi:hypothetical protein
LYCQNTKDQVISRNQVILAIDALIGNDYRPAYPNGYIVKVEQRDHIISYATIKNLLVGQIKLAMNKNLKECQKAQESINKFLKDNNGFIPVPDEIQSTFDSALGAILWNPGNVTSTNGRTRSDDPGEKFDDLVYKKLNKNHQLHIDSANAAILKNELNTFLQKWKIILNDYSNVAVDLIQNDHVNTFKVNTVTYP